MAQSQFSMMEVTVVGNNDVFLPYCHTLVGHWLWERGGNQSKSHTENCKISNSDKKCEKKVFGK